MDNQSKCAIVISVFVKDDLINNQIKNLAELDNIDNYHVIFVQDSLLFSPKYSIKKHEQHYNSVFNKIKMSINKFKSCECIQLTRNYGPPGTCQAGMDYAFNTLGFQYAISIEDDVILSKNSLLFTELFISKFNLGLEHQYQFLGYESMNYKYSADKTYEVDFIDRLKLEIRTKKSYENIKTIYHVPSSIFLTSKCVWNTQVRYYRGKTNGPKKLIDYLKSSTNYKIAVPEVPYAKDIGMLHENGWSRAWKPIDKIPTKNNYFLADEFDSPTNLKIL